MGAGKLDGHMCRKLKFAQPTNGDPLSSFTLREQAPAGRDEQASNLPHRWLFCFLSAVCARVCSGMWKEGDFLITTPKD